MHQLLSMVLFFLLVRRHLCVDEVLHSPIAEETVTSSSSNSNSFRPYPGVDYIDLARHQQQLTGTGNGPPLQTGQTTRIFTTGDVDDDFWYKLLGEDFKQAIHLQVDGNNEAAYRNMSHSYQLEHALPADFDHHAYHHGPYGQQEQQLLVEYPTANPVISATASVNATNQTLHSVADQPELTGYRTDLNTSSTGNHTSPPTPGYDQSFERIYALDDHGLNLLRTGSYVNDFHATIPPPIDQQQSLGGGHKIKKHIKPSSRNRSNGSKRKSKGRNNKMPHSQSPIVINLPVRDDVIHHIDDCEDPVIVKMPPIIYHRNEMMPLDENTQLYTTDHYNTTQQQLSITNPQNTQTFNTDTHTQQNTKKLTVNTKTTKTRSQQQKHLPLHNSVASTLASSRQDHNTTTHTHTDTNITTTPTEVPSLARKSSPKLRYLTRPAAAAATAGNDSSSGSAVVRSPIKLSPAVVLATGAAERPVEEKDLFDKGL